MQRTIDHRHHSDEEDLVGLGIVEKKGITELLGREFSVMIKSRHAV